MMAALMAFVAILGILSTVAFQEYAELLRRDNEAEMMFRAQDIVRAIQRYRLDHGGQAPLELDLLMEPGPKGNYYLRRLYEDPLVPDGKWGLLYVGPGNQIIDPNSEEQAGILDQLSGARGSLDGRGRRTGLDGRNDSGRLGNSRLNDPNAGGAGGKDPNQGNSGSSAFGSGNRNNRNDRFGSSGSGLGSGESTGLPIAGVRTLSDDKPFRVYNGLTDYGQWQFTFLDLETQKLPGQGAGPGGNRGGGPGSNRGGGLGQQGGNSGRGGLGSNGRNDGSGNLGSTTQDPGDRRKN